MQDDDELEDVEGSELDTYDPFDDDDPDAPNLVPEAGPSPCVLPGGIEMRRLIGEGGMGKVYLAYHLRLRCDLAVKVLNQELELRVDSQERLLREGLVLASIQHENIVRVHHCDKTPEGQLFIVMENLQGENLRQLRARVGEMDALAVVKIGLQICRALEVAHSFGVIHRDLTPSNVMVLHEPDGLVKVIDFGVCRLQDTFHARHSQRYAEPPGSRMATPVGVQLGNPEYMAPELFIPEPFVSPNARTDVFSVAVVLFELLVGERPFRHGDRTRARSVRELMPEFEYIELEQALGSALIIDPEHRTQTMADLRDALELAHDCILAQRGEDPDAPSPRRRRPAKLVRLDTFRPEKDLDEEADDQPRARFLEIVRADEPADAAVEEPVLAPVVALRGTTTGPVPTTTETADEEESASDRAAPAVALVLPTSAAPPPISTHAAPNWLTTHMIGLVLTTGLVGGVGVTLASQRIGESMLAAPARLAEAEAAAESCEGELEETQASLARTTQELRLAQQARIPGATIDACSDALTTDGHAVARRPVAPEPRRPRTIAGSRGHVTGRCSARSTRSSSGFETARTSSAAAR
jgi:serine/threonine protein kinase